MKPDVIVSWPRSCDYPLWRQFIQENRERFARVIVAFTEHDGQDLRPFVRASFDAHYVDTHRGYRDWRDVAVNAALDHSDAEWVWFTEQDLTVTDESFWPDSVAGFQEAGSGRWHPAALFVTRELIERTSRYFGPEPIDHFMAFGRELERLTPIALLTGFTHMQGLSQNHHLIDTGQTAGLWRMDEFRAYLRRCLEADVPLDAEWRRSAEVALSEHSPLP